LIITSTIEILFYQIYIKNKAKNFKYKKIFF